MKTLFCITSILDISTSSPSCEPISIFLAPLLEEVHYMAVLFTLEVMHTAGTAGTAGSVHHLETK